MKSIIKICFNCCLLFILSSGLFVQKLYANSEDPRYTRSTNTVATPTFYQRLHQLAIPVEAMLHQKTLSRYQLTRLLNAVECHDCIIPSETMRRKYDESFWSGFVALPGKDFRDIKFLSAYDQNINYYYCVAKIGHEDTMRGYPLATSSICMGIFCGARPTTKGEFFQTLSNLLIERVKGNYQAPWKDIKMQVAKIDKKSYEYRVFTSTELELIQKKEKTEKIASRLEFTSYLKYCMFHPRQCGFQTFEKLKEGMWPLSEMNILIQAGIITAEDVYALDYPISPEDALKKLSLLYDLHIKCDFDTDYDCDDIPNYEDNCPEDYNPSQNDLDGDGKGDVCDQDIDGDGLKNPIGLVDDTGNINYVALKKEKSEDPSPLGENTQEHAYFIKVIGLSNTFPTLVKFEIESKEKPLSVERDFGDLMQGKGLRTQHIYNTPGIKTITAKVNTRAGESHLISQQIFL